LITGFRPPLGTRSASKELFQLSLHPRQGQEADSCSGLKADEKVDIAPFIEVRRESGAEERQLLHSIAFAEIYNFFSKYMDRERLGHDNPVFFHSSGKHDMHPTGAFRLPSLVQLMLKKGDTQRKDSPG
jgi:hypothetical protein